MNQDIAVFAQTTYRNEFKKFGIKTDDRRRHMYLIGKTGMGKSTVLENMIVGDIRAGKGVAVVDPHGDLAERIMNYIPSDRIKDVVYFNPADIEYPIAFNIVEQVEPHLRHLVSSGLIGVFRKLWADSWGPRLEYILRNAILAVLDFPGSTLLSVVRILSDKDYRKIVVANIENPVVKAFWEKEFAGYAGKFASEAVSPIQNKVGQFLSSSLIRNVVGQVESAIDIRDIMDNGKILIMNLSKGRIGEDNSALLGAMMITKIQLASMSRVDVLEKDRRDFYLYIDEFQNFSTDSFANILSEARKYRLNLILAHQYIEQLSETVKPAVFGNVGTMIVFRVGATDAEELVKEFLPVFTEEDLVNLPKYEMYLKLMIDGISSLPFSAAGLPPLGEEEETDNVQKVIDFSRQKYASQRKEVEEKIMSWHQDYGPAKTIPVSKATSTRVVPNSKTNLNTKLVSNNKAVPDTKLTLNNKIVSDNKSQVSRTNESVSFNKSSVVNKSPSLTINLNSSSKSKLQQIKRDKQMKKDKMIDHSQLIPSNSSFNSKNDSSVGDSLNSVRQPLKTTNKNSKIVSKALPREGLTTYQAVCSSCGQETQVIFKPDGIRPVYCRDCLSKKKLEKRQELLARKLAKEEEKRQEQDRQNREYLTEDSESLSLDDLKNMNPRNFKGQKIESKNNSQRITREVKFKSNNGSVKQEVISQDDNQGITEGELKEGEEISINNNQF